MVFKRRKLQKTDYRQRLALLKSGKPRLVVRRSLNSIHVQLAEFEPAGDKIILEETSKKLEKYGWRGHFGNISAAYLAGLLIGLKARRKSITEVILDIGMQTSVKGASLYAVAMGARDAGLKIPVGDVLPSAERVSGKHIADFAALLKKENQNAYRKQFSAYLKNNINPEEIQKHFEEVKGKIISESGVEMKSRKEIKTTTSGQSSEEAETEEWEDAG